MSKKLLLLVTLHLSFLTCLAQWGPSVESPVVHADRTVTFNYVNKNARQVLLDAQFCGRKEMTRSADGLWTVTVGPAAPDIYPYCFIVDGRQVMDPQNAEWFPNEGFKSSLLDIRGDGLIHALRNIPHGSVDYVNYWSDAMGRYGNAIVYTPPFYDKNPKKKYPVMYLISGTTDTEEVYFKVGKMNLILDNLIAEGKAKEMIIVLPYGNPQRLMGQGNISPTVFDLFNRDMLDNLMPYVESHYRTINDAAHRAIGGFSRGGNQALSIGLNNLDKFSHLCSYSSFTQLRPGQLDDAATLNKKIRLFWLGVGKDDFLYGNAREFMKQLDDHGIRNVKLFTEGKFGHSWMNARLFLDHSFRLLFQSNPYKGTGIGSKQLTNTRAADAPEPAANQNFTPGVMARMFPKPIVSPEYLADGTVTFRLMAPEATKVELECQMFGGHREMTRDEDGVWSINVKPAEPDIYPYSFYVDGTQVNDPSNTHLFPNEHFKGNLCDVPQSTPTTQDIQRVPHGKVSYRFYHSTTCDIERPMCVYTPADYDPSGTEKLPVLYLIHGMTDTYETWFKAGRMNNILDNLIAQGEAKRMIVVMPYANPYPEMILQGKADRYDATDTRRIVSEIVNDVRPFIEKNYQTLTDADHRAVAGFSLGGRQSLATGLGNPDLFHWVAAYAPAIFQNEYRTNFETGVYRPIPELKEKLHLMWLGTGKDDFLLQASLSLDRYMTEQGLPHTFYNPGGGHTWMNCRDYLELTAKELFK